MIAIEKLKFRWRADLPWTLDVESFQVKKGESVFIKGPSGSGKSTLLNLIGGVLTPTEGKVAVMDQDLSRLTPSDRDHLRGHHMGFIFQQFNLMPYLSVMENILLPVEFSEIKRAKLKADKKDEAKRLVQHLKLKEEVLSKPVTQLSVGQQQRVAVARAVIGGPDLVIADEPTSALDADTRESFIKVLFQECKEAQSTLVFVSHDGFLGKFFDRQIDLSQINRAYQPTEF
jgi:putative ABC transport system ATP-binding protein